MTGDLAVWLRAQLDADEQTARAAADQRSRVVGSMPLNEPWGMAANPDLPIPAVVVDPAFILAGITAKRAIIDLHTLTETDWYGPTERECVACWSEPYPCPTLRLLAQPYAGRPGWHNEWTMPL